MEWVPKALSKGLKLAFESVEDDLYVQGDEVLLRELLINLIDNAINYSSKDGNIIVSLNSNPTPCLTVEDDGAGIPEKETNKIFERFYRIPGSAGNGCGLGLAIVKEIADLHNARIHLGKSEFRSGTRIDLIF
jgi:two-component system sensor histidine kinase TctE